MNTFESSTDRYNPGVCGLSDEARTNIAVSLPTESLEVIHIPSELVTATQAIDRLMERRERKSERLCWRKEQHAKQWDPEKILKATEDAQAKSLKPRAPGMVFGLSRGFSSWLMREGHEYEALGLEILTALGMTDKPLTREEIISGLRKYSSERNSRVVFEWLTGKGKDRAKKKYTSEQLKERKRYQAYLRELTRYRGKEEFRTQTDALILNTINTNLLNSNNHLSKFVSETPTDDFSIRQAAVKRTIGMIISNLDAKSLAPARTMTGTAQGKYLSPAPDKAIGKRKCGRPAPLYIIPGERERVGKMLWLGIISAETLEAESWEFSYGYLKDREDLMSMQAYKDYQVAWKVEMGGKKADYSRGELADPSGISRSSVPKRVRRRGHTVKANPPNLRQLTEEDLLKIPINDAEYYAQVEDEIIPHGAHLRDDSGFKHKYRRKVAEKLIREGHRVYLATYTKSTYIPKGTRDDGSTE